MAWNCERVLDLCLGEPPTIPAQEKEIRYLAPPAVIQAMAMNSSYGTLGIETSGDRSLVFGGGWRQNRMKLYTIGSLQLYLHDPGRHSGFGSMTFFVVVGMMVVGIGRGLYVLTKRAQNEIDDNFFTDPISSGWKWNWNTLQHETLYTIILIKPANAKCV